MYSGAMYKPQGIGLVFKLKEHTVVTLFAVLLSVQPQELQLAINSRDFARADIRIELIQPLGIEGYRTRVSGYEYVHEDGFGAALWYEDRCWIRNSGHNVHVLSSCDRADLFDVRTMGLEEFGLVEDLAQVVPEGIEFYERIENGDTVIVNAHSHHFVTSFEIDPARQYNVVRASKSRRDTGEVVLASEVTLSLFGAVWFPQLVEVSNADGSWHHTIVVVDALIESSSLPESLTPNDIGVGPGFNVFVEPETRVLRGWNGFEIVDWSDIVFGLHDGVYQRPDAYVFQRCTIE